MAAQIERTYQVPCTGRIVEWKDALRTAEQQASAELPLGHSRADSASVAGTHTGWLITLRWAVQMDVRPWQPVKAQ